MEYKKRLQRLIKNKNFLNNQNYVLGEELYKNISHGMSSSTNGKNIIGFDQTKNIQEISLVGMKVKTIYSLIFWNIFGVIFGAIGYLIWNLEESFMGIIFIFASILFLLAVNNNSKSKYYGIYKNKDTIIIKSKIYYKV